MRPAAGCFRRQARDTSEKQAFLNRRLGPWSLEAGCDAAQAALVSALRDDRILCSEHTFAGARASVWMLTSKGAQLKTKIWKFGTCDPRVDTQEKSEQAKLLDYLNAAKLKVP